MLQLCVLLPQLLLLLLLVQLQFRMDRQQPTVYMESFPS